MPGEHVCNFTAAEWSSVECASGNGTDLSLAVIRHSSAGTFGPFQNAIGVSRHCFRWASPWLSAQRSSGITFADIQSAMRAGAGTWFVGHDFPPVVASL